MELIQLSNKEKNRITKILFNIILNEDKKPLEQVVQEWKLVWQGIRISPYWMRKYLVSDHRQWVVYMALFFANQSWDLDSTLECYETGKIYKMDDFHFSFNIEWLRFRLREIGVEV